MDKNKLFLTDEWHEDMHDCLFFHFNSFEEPPEVLFSSPLCSDFDEEGEDYWTHFIRLDGNDIIEQAIQMGATP